jgi:hypothetical protein
MRSFRRFYLTAPSGAKSCLFPCVYAFLSIRNFTQCTRQQIFPRRCEAVTKPLGMLSAVCK